MALSNAELRMFNRMVLDFLSNQESLNTTLRRTDAARHLHVTECLKWQ